MGLRELIYDWNPWFITGKVSKGKLGFPRLKKFEKLLKIKGLTKVIIGPRRSGKTTLVYQYINKLINEGVDPLSILYIDLEDPSLLSYTLQEIYEEFLKISKNKKNYIFFDEIQTKPNWYKWIRKAIDKGEDEIFVTGSTSLLLKQNISSLLAGRFVTVEVFPFSFREVLDLNNISLKSEKERIIASSLLEECLIFGCYPRVLEERDTAVKRVILREYLSSVASKDVAENFSLDYRKAMEIIEYIIRNSSSLFSINKLKTMFKMRYELMEKYVNAFKESFLLIESRRFSFSLREQLAFPRKFYVLDNGFKTIISSPSPDKGKLLENFIASELFKAQKSFFYFRDKYECDFIIVESGKPSLALQVSYKLGGNKEREEKALEEARIHFKIPGKIITFDNAVEFLYHLPIGKNLFK